MPRRWDLNCARVSAERPVICATSSSVSNQGEVLEPGLPWLSIFTSLVAVGAAHSAKFICFRRAQNGNFPALGFNKQVAPPDAAGILAFARRAGLCRVGH
jgi:hypothetical protein